jgi:hypothetical protein
MKKVAWNKPVQVHNVDQYEDFTDLALVLHSYQHNYLQSLPTGFMLKRTD